MRLRTDLLLVAALVATLIPGAALAQETDDDVVERHPTEYFDGEAGWDEHRLHVAGYGGGLSGGTALGQSQNLFFRVQFEQGSDSAFGGRVGWVFAPRFDVELEYGRSSPGVDAVLSDLQGQGRTVTPYADLDLSWLVASVNYSVIERARRIVPYLTLGIGRMGVSSSTEPDLDTSEIVLSYGAGLRVRVADPFAVRADVRGLRSGLGGKDEEGDVPDLLRGQFNGTNLLWTLGVEFRF